MAKVKFNFRDSRGRPVSRTFWNTEVAVADVITEVGTLAGLWNPLTDLEFESVNISFVDPSAAFAGASVSNRAENVSVQVQGGDGRLYDVDLPDVPDAKTVGEAMSLADTDLIAFFAEFAGGGTWRVNLNNPTTITSIISATLDP
jgi:hypothetical protein